MADIKYIVRIADTDLDGRKHIVVSLQKIYGVSIAIAHAVCNLAGIPKQTVTGTLTEDQIKKLTSLIKDPSALPTWMYNRRKDIETGEDLHLIGGDLTFTTENDLKRMKMTKSYVGLRHAWNLPVRGQRNQSNHRPNKRKKSSSIKKRK